MPTRLTMTSGLRAGVEVPRRDRSLPCPSVSLASAPPQVRACLPGPRAARWSLAGRRPQHPLGAVMPHAGTAHGITRIGITAPLGRARGDHNGEPHRENLQQRQCSFKEIPVIDFSRLGGPAEAEAALVQELRDACHNVGFFYAAQHGVDGALLERTLAAAEAFFALPAETKRAMDNAHSPAFRGYVVQGAENTAGMPDEREQVEFGVEVEGAAVALGGGKGDGDADERATAPVYRRLVGPNQWPPPEACPEFRPTMLEFMREMEALSRRVMAALALSLQLPPDAWDATFRDHPNVQMKIARYPPLPTAAAAAGGGGAARGRALGRYGVGPHSDSGYLSLLLQDAVGGLQVRNTAGDWIDAPPMPGTLVVNLGEMLQLATGGYYVATVHRVVPAAANAAGRARYSVPYFFNPHLDAEIRRLELPSGLRWERPPPAVESDTHRGGNRFLPVYGDNAFKSLARSHPRVTARFHGDLEEVGGRFVRRRGA